jgi:hypothetical protein
MIFGNINPTLNVDLLYDVKPAMRNKYNPLLPWHCENMVFKPLMTELNPSAQCCLTRFFTGDFAS